MSGHMSCNGLQEFDGENLLKYNSLVVALVCEDLLVVHDVILVKGKISGVGSFRHSRILVVALVECDSIRSE